MGPSQGERGGERIPGRGMKFTLYSSGSSTDSFPADPLEWDQTLNKISCHYKVLIVQFLSKMNMELRCLQFLCITVTHLDTMEAQPIHMSSMCIVMQVCVVHAT